MKDEDTGDITYAIEKNEIKWQIYNSMNFCIYSLDNGKLLKSLCSIKGMQGQIYILEISF